MKKKIIISLLLLPLAAILWSCTDGKLTEVPKTGIATYEVHYSQGLKENNVASMFFPKTIECRYNENGLRFRTEGGFGMCVINIVSTVDNGFVALGLEKHRRYAVMFKDLFDRPEAASLADSITINHNDSFVEMSGWMSKSFSAVFHSHKGDINVDAFYVPMDVKKRLAYSPIEHIPGLVTAMSITYGDENIMFALKDLSNSKIPDSDFVIPDGYSQVSPEEMVRQLLSMIQ